MKMGPKSMKERRNKMRISIFSQPEFPLGDGGIPVELIEDILKKEGRHSEIFIHDATELSDPDKLNATKIDLLIMPYGKNFPLKSFSNILKFHQDGGSIINIGGVPFYSPFSWDEDKKRWAYSGKDYESGFNQLYHYTMLGLINGLSSITSPVKLTKDGRDIFKEIPQKSCFHMTSLIKPHLKADKYYQFLTTDGGRDGEKSHSPIVLVEHRCSKFFGARFIAVGSNNNPDYWRKWKYTTPLIKGLLKVLKYDYPKEINWGLGFTRSILYKKEDLQVIVIMENLSDKPKRLDLCLDLIDENGDYVRKLTRKKFSLPGCKRKRLTLPFTLTDMKIGRYLVELSTFLDNRKIGCMTERFSYLGRKSKKTKVEVANYNSLPTLFMNKKPHAFSVYHLHNPRDTALYKTCEEFSKAGIHIYTWWSPLLLCWPEEGRYDYSKLNDVVEKILLADPKAYFLPYVVLSTPDWWDNKHPQELSLYDDIGTGYYGPIGRGAKPHLGCKNPSFASRLWRKEMGRVLFDYVRYTRDTFKHRFIGYQVAHGTCGEWYPFGEMNQEIHCDDFSEPMHDYFRNWLRTKYNNSVSELKKAWGDNEVDFTNAQVPSRIERFRTDLDTFRIPGRNQKVSDYLQCYAELVAEDINYFCSIVKKSSGGKSLAGAYHGYLMDCSRGANSYAAVLNAGGISKILDSPNIDFLGTTYSYDYRELGTGNCSFQSVRSSLQLHGKLVIVQRDENWGGGSYNGSFFPALPEGVKRDAIDLVAKGCCVQWNDFATGCLSKVMKTISKMEEIGNSTLTQDRSHINGIAMIVDEESLFYMKSSNTLLYPLMYKQRQLYFDRIGTPWDVYLHNDLGNSKMPDYKVYLFLNTFYLTDEERQVIEKKVKRDNNIVIWMYAPGFLNEKGASLKNMLNLTGLHLNYENIAAELHIAITDFDHPFTEGISQQSGSGLGGAASFFGSDGVDDREGIIGPVFWCDDPNVKVLGKLECVNKPGFCVKKFKDWTSVYVAAPMITAKILRNICKYAGVHIYCETEDLIYANKHLLSIHANKAGRKTIKLPQESAVYDLMGEKLISKKTVEFSDYISSKTTKVYFLADLKNVTRKFCEEGERRQKNK